MIKKPIIIVGAPRSGTTILARCLSLHPELWHLRAESHQILEGPFHPERSGYVSNRVTAEDLTEDLKEDLQKKFYARAINHNLSFKNPSSLLRGKSITSRIVNRLLMDFRSPISQRSKTSEIRFLEKTPKNSLRIPMLAKLFPDALFIWNHRLPESNIDSLIDGWQAQNRMFGFSWNRYGNSGYNIMDDIRLEDYHDKRWKFVLVPGWRELKGKSLADAAAVQYVKCNAIIEKDLRQISSTRSFRIQHEEFVQSPVQLVNKILEWADLERSDIIDSFAQTLPKINTTKSNSKIKGELRFQEEVNRVINEYCAES